VTNTTCGTCRWWDVRRRSYSPYGALQKGLCRKDKPSYNNGGTGEWPTTTEQDWCGEHTPKGDE
jgi:hypothetical protein